MPKLLYVALADARGHLMRAHVLQRALRDVGVELATTSAAGVSFLRSLGGDAHLLPGRFGVALGPAHDLQIGRTRARFLRYALARDRLAADLAFLRERARGCAFVVNDSLHPALLLARDLRVLHVHGENVRAMVCARARPLRVERLLARAFGEIVHVLDDVDERRRRLPPPIALPSPRCTSTSGERVAAVYLNPFYRAPAIAALVETAVADAGLTLVGVSEAFAHRPGWRASDPRFIDVVARADVLISGAGMGALEQSRATGTPLVCLLGRQDEQAQNARARDVVAVSLDDGAAPAKLGCALRALPRQHPGHHRDARAEIERVHAMWTRVFLALIEEAERERRQAHHRARDRDEQPARRRRGRRRPLAPAPAHAPDATDAAAR